MDSKMTHATRAELANRIRRRYHSATSKQKRKILDEFIAVTGYHPKAAIRVLNTEPLPKRRQIRVRPSVYDDAARTALIVLWEASDRVCGKRLGALLPILVPALERHGHLKLDDAIRTKVLAMSASTIDRLLRMPRSTLRSKRIRRAVPELRRRVRIRTFTEWNEPPPGSMEMDLVAHCGEVNRGSYINSLVLTDIATGWTECAPLVVRESGLLVEVLERIRISLPFTLRALDVDNGSEFLNETLFEYCLRHGIEFTRSRPYRKNDQAWIEQKNGAVVRKLLGYRRFEGIGAAQALTRLYGASRLFVNFFQPSFKLAEKHRQGAQVTKRYHAPQTPCERLLQGEGIPESVKSKLREVAEALDPLQLLEEVRAVQAHLVAIADGDTLAPPATQPPNLAAFLASLSSAWRAGEVRPTFSAEAKPRYLRGLQKIEVVKDTPRPPVGSSTSSQIQVKRPTPSIMERPKLVYAKRRSPRYNAFAPVWPMICRRLEARPNMNSRELFDDLCAQFPGRYHRNQLYTLAVRVRAWRADARARGVEIGRISYRQFKRRARRRPDPFQAHWEQMLEYLDSDPDQTALELLIEFKARYPDRYTGRHLRTLQRRLKAWRREKVQQLICETQDFTQDVSAEPRSVRELLTPEASDCLSWMIARMQSKKAAG
jgi:hypothetical protein